MQDYLSGPSFLFGDCWWGLSKIPDDRSMIIYYLNGNWLLLDISF